MAFVEVAKIQVTEQEWGSEVIQLRNQADDVSTKTRDYISSYSSFDLKFAEGTVLNRVVNFV